jgi:1,4-dihydroxy-6-naphthoate synthase
MMYPPLSGATEMTATIRLGISTCPNDTFAFHALLERKVDWGGLEFQIELLDIQQLNLRLQAGSFDVAKASFFAALQLADRYLVLPSGSALGFGVGPLLLASRSDTRPVPGMPQSLTLCPGKDTTAHLLFQLFYSKCGQVEQVEFSEIMPRLSTGTADYGVCIHEGRFTWQQQGLHLVEDLGTRWEQTTGSPLPLGGIIASRELEPKVLQTVQTVIQNSLLYGLAHREETLSTMQRFAQELDESVIWQHVDLYVNEWTIDLGEVGHKALNELDKRARAAGLCPSGLEARLEILSQR